MFNIDTKYTQIQSQKWEKSQILRKQAFLIQKYSEFYSQSNPKLKPFVHSLVKLGKLTPIEGKLLDCVYRVARLKSLGCYLAQGTIATIIECSREYVNKKLKALETKGLIVWIGEHTFASRCVPGKFKTTNCYATKFNDLNKIQANWNNSSYLEEWGPDPKNDPEKAESSHKFFKSSFPSEKSLQRNTVTKKCSDMNLSDSAKRNTLDSRNLNEFENKDPFSGVDPSDASHPRTSNENKVSQKIVKDNRYSNNLESFKRIEKYRQSNLCLEKHVPGTDNSRRSNNCLEEQKMGFFAELEVTKKNSRFTDFDRASARKLRKAIVEGGFVYTRSLGSSDSWANEFYQLRKFASEEQIGLVLDWYIQNIGKEYIPFAFSAAAFRKKYNNLLLVMNRKGAPTEKVQEESETGKEYLIHINSWNWASPHVDKSQIKYVFLKNAESYRKLTKAIASTYKELYSKSLNHEFYLDTMKGHIKNAEEFAYREMEEAFKKYGEWKEWNGNIAKTIFDVKNEKQVYYQVSQLVKSTGQRLEDKAWQDIISSITNKLRG